jgi:hypothetical protein
MAEQLVLLEPHSLEWHLDPRTREVGRQGIAEARRAIRDQARERGGRPPSRPRAA